MKWFKAAAASAALFTAFSANAGNIYFFSDSLSDAGNISLIAPGNPNPTPQQPYQPGQYTDNGGFVWTVGFASALGQSNAARPSLLGGNNFAIAGARSYSLTNAPIGLDNQLTAFRARNATVTQADLFVIMIGGNDLAQFVTGGSQIGAATTLTNISNSISSLFTQNNARQFLVANMPDFGSTPLFQSLPSAAISGAIAARTAYNNAFDQMVTGLRTQLTGIDLDVLDFRELDKLNLASYGITNPTGTCFVYTGTAPAPNCRTYAYSDNFHPTSVVHSIIGTAALAAVPLPASALVFGLGLLSLLVARRTR
jgi:outer membrane lipase/esterase